MASLRSILSSLVIVTIAVGCGRFDKDSDEKKSEADKRFETVAYAGIVIFEGGRGERSFANLASSDDYTPLWRWSVCLDRSNEQRGGSIDVDMALSAPYTWEVTSEGETHQEHVAKATVNYTYQSQLEKFGGGDDKIVASEINFRSETSTDELADGETASEMVGDHLGFNIEWNETVISQNQVTSYTADGSSYYLYSTLLPYQYFAQSDDFWKVASLCAGRDSEPFLLQGNAIPR